MSRILFCLLVLIWACPAPAQDKEREDAGDDELVVQEKLGKLTLTLDPGGHTATIRKVFFMPDGKQVVTLSKDHSIRFWDVESGKSVKVLYPPGFGGFSVGAMSADGKRLAVASRYQEKDKVAYLIYVLALPEGKIERILKGHPKEIDLLAMSPDGKRLASADQEREKKGIFSIRLWDLEKDEPAKKLSVPRPTQGLAFSPDGSRLARVAPGKGGEITDLATGKTMGNITGDAVIWSPDGKMLATSVRPKDGVRLWDSEGKQLRDITTLTTNPRSLAFSADSERILTTWLGSSGGHSAAVFDVATGNALARLRPKVAGNPWDGAFSPDGKLAATCGGNEVHDLFLFKTEDGALVKSLGVPSWIIGDWKQSQAAWSADGKAVSWDENAKRAASFHLGELEFGPALQENDKRRWVRKQGDLLLGNPQGGAFEVRKDGVRILSLGYGRPTLVGDDRVAFAAAWAAKPSHPGFALYEVASDKLLRRFQEPNSQQIRSLAPSADGRFLLSLSSAQTLRVWSVDREKPLLSMYVRGSARKPGEARSVAGNDWIIWTPEGYYAATPGGERLMGFTVDNGMEQMPTFYAAERFRKQLYRPDVIKLLLEKGNLKDALETANAALKKQGKVVLEGVADPNKLLPPRVGIEILDKSNLPNIKLRVTATASGKTQPITALRLLVDGRPLPGSAGYVEFKPGRDEFKEEWTITLPGEKQNAPYHLALLVRGPDTSAFSQPVEIPYVNPKKQPNMHVLAIGINEYKEKSLRLGAPVNDAQAIAANFEKCAKGPLFRDVQSKKLLDGQATPAAILAELDALRKQVKHNDLVVVFFAGHGVKSKNGFYLLTPDADTSSDDTLKATSLSGDELRRKLGGFPCQVLLLVDACHSGAFGKRGPKKDVGVLGKRGLKPATDDLARDLADDEAGVAILCAAMGHEKAQEKGPQGLFTKAILEALNRADPRVQHRHYRLFLHHLHTFVLDRVAEESEDEQHPFLVMPSVVESFPLVQFAKKAPGGS